MLWPRRPPPLPRGDLDIGEPPSWPAACSGQALWQRKVGAWTCPACSCCLAWAVFSLRLFVSRRGSNCGRALWVRQPLAPLLPPSWGAASVIPSRPSLWFPGLPSPQAGTLCPCANRSRARMLLSPGAALFPPPSSRFITRRLPVP